MNIFLLGFMGSGKSTFGRKLSKSLNLEFLDLDKMIEEHAKCCVTDIFKYLGEESFRKMESDCLKSVADKTNFLMATGGGTPCFFDNMDFMKNNGISIYIHLDEKAIFSRLVSARNVRPTIKGLSEDQLRVFIHETLSKREAIYKRADICIPGIDIDLREVEEKIKNL